MAEKSIHQIAVDSAIESWTKELHTAYKDFARYKANLAALEEEEKELIKKAKKNLINIKTYIAKIRWILNNKDHIFSSLEQVEDKDVPVGLPGQQTNVGEDLRTPSKDSCS